MAIAFSEKEKIKIEEKLLKVALKELKHSSYKQIKVEDLVSKVGISKGAFYHFFNSKEELFYKVMVNTHNQIYGEATTILCEKGNPKDKITKAILNAISSLKESGLWDFYFVDSKEIISKMDEETLHKQREREDELYDVFFKSCGKLKVSKNLAKQAISTLIYSSFLYEDYENYEEILGMLVMGVCESIFD